MIIFEVTKVSLYKQVKKTKAHETKGLKTKEKSKLRKK